MAAVHLKMATVVDIFFLFLQAERLYLSYRNVTPQRERRWAR